MVFQTKEKGTYKEIYLVKAKLPKIKKVNNISFHNKEKN